MKSLFSFLLIVFCFNTTWADFSDTSIWYHPVFIGYGEPYILDFRGEWPTDCHPGEQKPVISEYTGLSALIEFETIVEHLVCNDTPTTYRVLVDMSDVVNTVTGEFNFVAVTIRFGGDERTYQFDKNCVLCGDPVPPPRDIKPDAGLYYSDGLEKQGLLLARQHQRMGAYPLIYDESGSSEWVLGPGGIVEDVFFAELFESTGGQCLGCPPPDVPPQMGSVGKISMLMDSQGLIQVKINDGLFKAYQQIEFGYGDFVIFNLDDNTANGIPNLSGRWAFSEDNSDWPGETTPKPTSTLPLVFDIALRSTVNPPPPVVTTPPGEPVFYAILNIEAEIVAEMNCGYSDGMVCELRTSELSDFDESYKVQMISVERMIMTNIPPTGPANGVVPGAGTAVRID